LEGTTDTFLLAAVEITSDSLGVLFRELAIETHAKGSFANFLVTN
jgi:hypothetical protein